MPPRIPAHIRLRVTTADALRDLAFDVRDEVFKGRWDVIGDIAAELSTLSLAELAAGGVEQTVFLEQRLLTSSALTDVRGFLRELAGSAAGRSHLAGLAAEVKNPASASLAKLADGRVGNNDLLDTLVQLDRDHQPTPQGYEPVIGLAVASLARAHVAFNGAAPVTSAGQTAPARLGEQSEALAHACYIACMQGASPSDLVGIITGQVPSMLGLISQTAALVRTESDLMTAMMADGQNAAAEQVGRVTVDWTRTIREASATIAATASLVLAGFAEAHDALVDPAAVTRMSFGFDEPDGVNTPIGRLKVDKLSDIDGLVNGVRVRRKGKHLYTTIDLLDPSSGDGVPVVASFVNGHNLGIEVGSYLKCTGTLKASSTLNNGAAAFHIEQVELAELAKTSWRAALLKLSSGFMPIWPNGHTMSWGMGSQTATEFETPGNGAGEITLRTVPDTKGW